VQYEHTSAPGGGATMIDWRAGRYVVHRLHMDFGQPACVASFTSSSSHAKFIGNHGLGLTSYSYNGQLLLVGNTHIPGTVTPSNLGSGFLRQLWDDGGAFSNQGMSPQRSRARGRVPDGEPRGHGVCECSEQQHQRFPVVE
jgi:hypothetical protein